MRRSPQRSLVLVPGLGDDAASWSSVSQRLGLAHLCRALDHPAVADSVSIAELAAGARRQAQRQLGSPVVLIGCSMGAAICQEWALAHPEEVVALVLISGWAGPDPLLELVLSHWQALAEAGDTAALARSGAELTFSAAYLREHPGAAAECEIAGLHSYAAMAHACRRHDARERLPSVTVPTLVLSGDRDRIVCADAADELGMLIPGSQRHVLGTGHVPHWEQPDETIAAIETFLIEIGGSLAGW